MLLQLSLHKREEVIPAEVRLSRLSKILHWIVHTVSDFKRVPIRNAVPALHAIILATRLRAIVRCNQLRIPKALNEYKVMIFGVGSTVFTRKQF